ncbi:MAG: PBSX family phage terminase large subunit, partial [Firmicutes bacterium]|nr:PBSX family phage terminase large subunit [Bacillota bacterium]
FDKRRTPNAYREFSRYEYETDRNGKYRSTYPNAKNHSIDCARYAMETDMLQNRIIFSSLKF